jgi:hypothetical protein
MMSMMILLVSMSQIIDEVHTKGSGAKKAWIKKHSSTGAALGYLRSFG